MKNLTQCRQSDQQNDQAIKSQMSAESTISPVYLGREHRASKLVAEWQLHGPETLSGLAVRKLRLVLVPPQPLLIANSAV